MRHALLLCLLALPACGPWPDLGRPPPAAPGFPELVPFDALLGRGGLTPEEEAAAAEAEAALLARAEALRARAAILEAPAGDAEALEALRERLAAPPE